MVYKCIVIIQKCLRLKMKYKAILFDLDYTLYNENKFLREVIFSSQIFTNPIFAAEEISYSFRINSQNIIEDMLRIEDLNSKSNSDHIFGIMKNLDIKLSCYNGIKKMFYKLKKDINVKTCLVTNGVPGIQKNKLRLLNLEKYFNEIIFANELGSQKPNREPFLIALKYLQVPPELALFVGDHSKNDIEPSKMLGLDTLWIDHLKKEKTKSTYRITNPNFLSTKILSL